MNIRLSAAAAVFILVVATDRSGAFAQGAGAWDSRTAIRAESAKVEIKDQVELAAEVPGKLIELNPSDVGKAVSPGQVVVKLDGKMVEAQMKVVEAQLEEAKLAAEEEVLIEFADIKLKHAENDLKDKMDRNAKLGGKYKVFSETEIRKLELDVEQARAELKKAKYDQKKARQTVETKKIELDQSTVELSQYTLEASIGGIVTDLHYKVIGSSVRQGDPIMTIVNLDEVLAYLEVTTSDYEKIQLGDTVLVRRTTRTKSDTGSGGADAPFKSTARPGQQQKTSTAAAQPPTSEAVTFTGVVTHFSNTAKTDKDNKIRVVAVIKNKLSGPGKYLLREGSFIEARILPQ